MLAYCDYIAHLIKRILTTSDDEHLLTEVGPVRYALDKHGALVGTAKRIEVADINGKRYRITVEEV